MRPSRGDMTFQKLTRDTFDNVPHDAHLASALRTAYSLAASDFQADGLLTNGSDLEQSLATSADRFVPRTGE